MQSPIFTFNHENTMVPLTSVQSSMLQAFGYDAASQTLAVRFGPGKVHHYVGVPADTAEALAKSESIGKGFNALIRGKFEHTVVLDETQEA